MLNLPNGLQALSDTTASSAAPKKHTLPPYVQKLQQAYPEAWEHLTHLWSKGQAFLGVPVVFLAGAMTWVSNPELVTAMGRAGGFGILASGAMPPDIFAQAITKTQKANIPFGVNLIVMHPQFDQMVDCCLVRRVSHVVLAGGLPPMKAIEKMKAHNIKVITFAPTAALAKRLARSGVDAFIVEGHEAGGHIGPVATSVLAQEILDIDLDVPVFAAGGIGHGSMIASYLRMGAAGCQMGTCFVCAEESPAHPRFKQAFIRATARDAIVSPQLDPCFPVVPVRSLKNKASEAFVAHQKEIIQKTQQGLLSKKEGQLAIEHFWAGALRRAVEQGDIETGSLMAGQSVGLVKEVKPLQDIMATLLEQTLVHLHTHLVPSVTSTCGSLAGAAG